MIDKKKQGFTIVELLAVMVILSVIFIIAIPNIITSIDRNKEKQYNAAVTKIIGSAEQYVSEHKDELIKSELEATYFVSLDTLVKTGYLSKIPVNPKTDEKFSDPDVIILIDANRKYSYQLGNIETYVADFYENLNTNGVTNFTYTGKYQYHIIQKTGIYRLETWGAQGGTGKATGGLGGYSYVEVKLEKGTKVYVYVGGAGKSGNDNSKGGFNGGGRTYAATNMGGSGGGATDIRIIDNQLKNRIVIAGGGGGGGSDATAIGGAGGGTTGENGKYATATYNGSGASTSGGAAATYVTANNPIATSGQIGQGGDGGLYSTTYSGGAGGGGYYGGGGGARTGGGGGGSGYAADGSFSANSIYDSATFAGDQTFIGPNNKLETGHSGDGNAKITYMPVESTKFVYKGEIEQYKIPYSGTYLLQAWGAQGGSSGTTEGGLGGYGMAKVSLKKDTILYIGVGGAANGIVGGFNGGGTTSSATTSAGGGGGGASHIALTDGTLASLINQQSSILLVAGGGGGSASTSIGGGGGGITALTGGGSSSYYGTGGSNTSPGKGSTYATSTNPLATSGLLGQGGGGGLYSTTYSGGAGGGGYYGGGGGTRTGAGGGGSGYATLESTLQLLVSGGSTNLFPSVSGGMNSVESGHANNGYVKVTYMP